MNIPKELIGEKVHHRILKYGSIVDCTDLCILVRFDNEVCDQKPHKFPFPDIMLDERNLMTTDSKVINDFLTINRANHNSIYLLFRPPFTFLAF